jgi:hypothetical protein
MKLPKQTVKKFVTVDCDSLIAEIEKYATDNNLMIQTISHNSQNSVMGNEYRAIVVFNIPEEA